MRKHALIISILFIALAAASFAQPSGPERVPAREASAAKASQDEFPVKNVVLFSSGVGYFLRQGEVNGSGSIELKFDVKDINDLLKSMVLQDAGGGKITGVSYASREPLARTLKSFSLDLSDNPDLPLLLSRARGEKIEVWAGERYEGVILGVETRPDSENGAEKTFINLLGDRGLQSVPYGSVTSLKFQNEKLNAELKAALLLIAESRNADKKGVVINYTGEGRRRIQAGYLLETPVWKTSYRLVVGETNRHLLQGWAIVENTGDEDWKDVKLDLVSGLPVSFAMDLYQPLFNPRPVVAYALQRAVQSRTYAGGIAPPPAPPAASAPAPMRVYEREAAKKSMAGAVADEEAPSFDPSRGVDAAASSEAVGEFFRYTISDPVSLPRKQSAMIPILNQEIEGERISIYNESALRKNPMNGLRIKNTSPLSLMGGPLTVFEAGAYAGDARIDNLPAGGKRMIGFSVDLDTEVMSLDTSLPELITRIRLRRGVLYASKILKKEKTYTFINRGEKSRTVLVEHPASADWKLVEPLSYDERTEDLYRFSVKIPAIRDGKTELKVTEERSLEQSVVLSSMNTDTILFYVNQRNIGAGVKNALETLAGMKNDLADILRRRQGVEAQINQIYREQERIRSNMANLDRTSALYQRYLKALNDQEDAVTGLKEKLDELQTQEGAKKKALDDYLAGLEVG